MWYVYTMEYYSAIKRNKIESFVATCVDQETVIQSGVSQKDKNIYGILTHIFGIQKNGTDETIFREGIEMQTQRTDLWLQGGRRVKERWIGSLGLAGANYYIYGIDK